MSPLPSLHYGPDTAIVFDGYEEGPSIKYNTHQRRGRNVHHVVSFTAQTELSGKKEEFLARDTNKQRLIQMISDQLRERYCIVVKAHGDADVGIVNTVVDTSCSTHYDAHWRRHGSTCLTPLISPGRGYEPLFQIKQAQRGWHY